LANRERLVVLPEDGEIPLGKRVQARRQYLALDRPQVAGAAECDPTHLAHIEAGRDRPSEDLFKRIAKALHIGEEELRSAPRELVSEWITTAERARQMEWAKHLGTQHMSRRRGQTSLDEPLPVSRQDPRPTETISRLARQFKNQASATKPIASSRRRTPVGAVVDEQQTQMSETRMGSHAPERIEGLEPLMLQALRLIEETAASGDASSANILLFFPSEGHVFSTLPYLRSQWLATLRDAVERGASITHVWTLDGDRARTHLLTEDMFLLLGVLGAPGRYAPLTMPQYRNAYAAPDLLLVPGRGGLELFLHPQRPDSAMGLVYGPGEELDVLCGYFRLLSRRCTPLVTAWHTPFSLEYDRAITAVEELKGSVGLIMDGVSVNTVPSSVDIARVESVPAGGGQRAFLQKLLASRERRRQAFLRAVRQAPYRHICPKRSIINLTQHGAHSADDWLTYYGAPPEDVPQITEHLEAIIGLLEETNYEIGLLDDRHADLCRTYWAVKEGHAAFLEAWYRDTKGKRIEVDLEIVQADVVAAYWQEFCRIWDDPQVDKDKDRVIAFFRDQLAALN